MTQDIPAVRAILRLHEIDQIPNLVNSSQKFQFFILNIPVDKEDSGRHWVAFVVDLKNWQFCYYDSLALSIPAEL